MGEKFNRKLVLENGKEFLGYGFGAKNTDCVTNLIFSTGVVGYQEILTDPSYTGQTVVMTYPLIGNYGITDEDNECNTPSISGFVVREYCDEPSNFRFTKTLSEVMEEHNIAGISGLDTRYLSEIVRDNVGIRGIITDINTPTEEAVEKIKNTEINHNVVAQISCKKKWYARTARPEYNIVAIDCGIKHSIIKCLNKRRCNVIVVPYNTSAEEILKLNPDGVIISNGAGCPKDIPCVIETIKELKGKAPMFGIALGYRLIANAYELKLEKMEQAHIGGSFPIKNVLTNKVTMSSQGHSYAVNADSLNRHNLTLTHINVIDKTVEGICDGQNKVMAVEFQPEGAPGVRDNEYLFDEFLDMIKK